MTIKLAGAFLIIISGTASGWIISLQYLKRIEHLQQLQLALNLFETEISYSQPMLVEVLFAISKKIRPPLADLFENTALSLLDNRDCVFAEIWENELKKNSSYNCLNCDDLQLLKEWGSQLGSSSLEGQKKINALTLKKLAQAEKEAREDARKKVKISRYGGLLLSLLIVILMI